jgi:hypothetical protein
MEFSVDATLDTSRRQHNTPSTNEIVLLSSGLACDFAAFPPTQTFVNADSHCASLCYNYYVVGNRKRTATVGNFLRT